MASLAAESPLALASVLVTGVGGPAGAAAVEALRGAGHRVVAVDMRPLEIEGCDFYTVPRADDPAYIGTLLELAVAQGVTWLFPTVADELLVVAEHSRWFRERGISVFISQPDPVLACFDKWELATRLAKLSIPVPKSAIGGPESPEVMALGLPCISKPRVGRGGRGVVLHETTGVAASTPDAIWQEFLAGTEYGVQAMIHPDAPFRVMALGVFEKKELREGRVGNAVSLEWVIAKDVEALALRAAEALSLTGPIDVDIRRGGDGEPKILEINARIGAHVLRTPEIIACMAELQSRGHLG